MKNLEVVKEVKETELPKEDALVLGRYAMWHPDTKGKDCNVCGVCNHCSSGDGHCHPCGG